MLYLQITTVSAHESFIPRPLVAMWLMSGTDDASQHHQRSKVNSVRVLRSLLQCGAPLCRPLYISKRKTHWTSWILHEGPAMTGWRGKQKGKISSESEREGKEKKDGGWIKRVLWGPTKTGFIAARVKWPFYSWFPPTHWEELPQDPLKLRRCASLRVLIQFVLLARENTRDNFWSPNFHTSARRDKHTPQRFWMSVCPLALFCVSFF